MKLNQYRVVGPRPWRGTPVGEVAPFDPEDSSVQRALDAHVLELVGPAQSRGKIHKPQPAGEPKGEELAPSVDEPENDGGSK